MSNPVVLPSGATALELVQKIIIDNTSPSPVPGTTIFMAYATETPDDAGLVYMVLEGVAGPPEFTMGTAVALEHTGIDVIVYGAPGDYAGPKREAMRLRYLLAAQGEYTALGLRMLNCSPTGNLEPLGKDPREREHMMVRFHATTDPSYS